MRYGCAVFGSKETHKERVMDTAEILVLLGGLALIAFVLWFFFGQREDTLRVAAEPTADAALYACPMHPWITSSDPAANCSICGMKLTRRD
jgi:hypothetical protein